MFMLGYAWQTARVPLSRDAIRRAIELNGEAVRMNLDAFEWGRRAAADSDAVEAIVAKLAAPAASGGISESPDEVVARRVAFLAEYQDGAYADRYRALVDRVRSAEARVVPGATALTEAVARSLFKLMAYKDEYEVARLYTNGHFARQVAATFEPGTLRYEFHLAPPFLARPDPVTGVPRKMRFGPWILSAFKVLAKLRGLRGTAFDPFGYTEERRVERRLVRDFEAVLEEVLAGLDPANHATAVGLATVPQRIKGYGHVKARNLLVARQEEAALLARFRSPEPQLAQAAE